MAQVRVKVSRFHERDGRIFFQCFASVSHTQNTWHERLLWQMIFHGYESRAPS